MPAAGGTQTLLDLIMRDPNAGRRAGIPFGLAPGPMGAPSPSGQQGIPSQQDMRSQRVGGGMPMGYGYGGLGGGSDVVNDPKNWFLTRGDLESPLQYMQGGPFVSGPSTHQSEWW